MSDENRQTTDSRRLVYFAAERTLTAWVRMSVSLMALGFVIDRFGLLLEQMASPDGSLDRQRHFSFWAGSALVALGIAMLATGIVRFWRFAQAYDHERDAPTRRGIQIAAIYASILGVFGLVLLAFLIAMADR
ncbi:MAG: DUF202 domain-containing protein [Rhodanobacteraceae bacterium]